MIETIRREDMKSAMIIGEAMAILNRQNRHNRIEEEAVAPIDIENDSDAESVGLSKYVRDGLQDLDLGDGDYVLDLIPDKDDDSVIGGLDLTIYGDRDQETLESIFKFMKKSFRDVIVKVDESLSNMVYFRCFTRIK